MQLQRKKTSREKDGAKPTLVQYRSAIKIETKEVLSDFPSTPPDLPPMKNASRLLPFPPSTGDQADQADGQHRQRSRLGHWGVHLDFVDANVVAIGGI